MRKHFKTFIVTALACSLLLGAGISAKAESKVAINDTNFSAEVKRKAEEADTNKDGYLSEGEASRVRTLRFDSFENIDSFKGIEYFTELENFFYRANTVNEDEGVTAASTASEIDLSGFEELKTVRIDSHTGYLKTVNLQDCTSLQDVEISGMRDACIDFLNLKGCTNLRTLNLSWPNITKLNLSGFKRLTEVTLTDGRGRLQTLNLRKCSSLKTLSVDSSSMTKLKLKGAKKLESLNLTGRALESLDLSTNTQLEEVYLGWGTKLSSLDLSSNKKLKTFECYRTELTSLDLRNHTSLIKVDCHNNKNLSAIKVKGCKKLKNLRFDNTALTKINVKTSPALQRLRCENTLLTKLNLKKNTKLKNLRCENTRLTQLDLSNTKIKDDSRLKCDPTVSVIYAD